MAAGNITHHKVATIPDDPNYEIKTSNWNEAHDIPASVPNLESTAEDDVIMGGATIGTWVKKTLAQLAAKLVTSLRISNLDLLIRGGGLLTGTCDEGEKVTTPVTGRVLMVNKFEKAETGQAVLDWEPSAWDLGTVTAKIKAADVGGNVLNNCDTAWDAAANVTCSADTSVKVEGTGSNKMACAAGLAAGALMATDVITSVDLTYALHIDFWFRSDVALNAGDVQLLIDNTATCASPTKSWDLPAISANTWTKVSIVCGDMSGAGNNAIISIGLKQVVDKGAMNCYIDAVSYRTNVTYQLQITAMGAGDDWDAAWGTVQEIAFEPGYYCDAVGTFPTLTAGGTPQAADRLSFLITRKSVATEAAGKNCFAGIDIILTRAV